MSRRYLITGGLGFLGSALARDLTRSGASVRVLDNGLRGRRRRLGPYADDIEVMEADIRDTGALTQACRDVDVLCHLAFVNGTRHFYERPGDVLDVGVRGMLSVLDACRDAEVPELVVASSSEVYQTPPVVPTDERVPLCVPDPRNPRYSYGGAKILSELMTLHCRPPSLQRALIFRPHNVYGPDMGWAHVIPECVGRLAQLRGRSAEAQPFVIRGDGTQTRAFVHIDDFTAGLRRIIERGEDAEIYHVGTREEISIGRLVQQLAEIVGVRIDLQRSAAPAGETPRRCPEISRLEALGYAPSVPLAEGLQQTARWYLQHPAPEQNSFDAHGGS